MIPQYISGIDNLNKNLFNNMDKINILMFTASWCGPCKQLKKELYTEADQENSICSIYSQNLNTIYIDVDDDNNSELLERYSVQSLPTLIFTKINTVNDQHKIVILDRQEGNDPIKLRLILDQNIN